MRRTGTSSGRGGASHLSYSAVALHRRDVGTVTRMSWQLTGHDVALLTAMEESLWRVVTRFDTDYMERILAADFIEFGRSGKTYTRLECLAIGKEPIRVRLPLGDLCVVQLGPNTAHVTYISEDHGNQDRTERANRSSIWSRTVDGWELRFHQGTPTT